jgi:hypothetical protein
MLVSSSAGDDDQLDALKSKAYTVDVSPWSQHKNGNDKKIPLFSISQQP